MKKIRLENIADAEILWKNNDSLTYFGEQQINFDFKNCDMIEIFYLERYGENKVNSIRVPKGYDIMLQHTSTGLGGLGGFGERVLTYSNSGYYVSSFKFKLLNNDGGINNIFVIPLYVLGYNTNLFS